MSDDVSVSRAAMKQFREVYLSSKISPYIRQHKIVAIGLVAAAFYAHALWCVSIVEQHKTFVAKAPLVLCVGLAVYIVAQGEIVLNFLMFATLGAGSFLRVSIVK